MTPIDRYTCEEVIRRLDDYVDRELSPREMQLAREHIETCAACAQEYAFTSGVLRMLKSKLRRIDVEPEVIERVTLRLATVRRSEPS